MKEKNNKKKERKKSQSQSYSLTLPLEKEQNPLPLKLKSEYAPMGKSAKNKCDPGAAELREEPAELRYRKWPFLSP